jgi:hypothetical protein
MVGVVARAKTGIRSHERSAFVVSIPAIQYVGFVGTSQESGRLLGTLESSATQRTD